MTTFSSEHAISAHPEESRVQAHDPTWLGGRWREGHAGRVGLSYGQSLQDHGNDGSGGAITSHCIAANRCSLGAGKLPYPVEQGGIKDLSFAEPPPPFELWLLGKPELPQHRIANYSYRFLGRIGDEYALRP